jgi:hypothetical protein
LDDKNYRRWSTLVQDAFEALGIVYTIQDEAGGSGIVKSTKSLTLIDLKPYNTHLTKLDAEIKADNAAALYMIKSLCSASNFDLIADARSAYRAWKLLQTVHKGKGKAHLMSLIRQFYSRKWN